MILNSHFSRSMPSKTLKRIARIDLTRSYLFLTTSYIVQALLNIIEGFDHVLKLDVPLLERV